MHILVGMVHQTLRSVGTFQIVGRAQRWIVALNPQHTVRIPVVAVVHVVVVVVLLVAMMMTTTLLTAPTGVTVLRIVRAAVVVWAACLAVVASRIVVKASSFHPDKDTTRPHQRHQHDKEEPRGSSAAASGQQ